MKILIVAPFFPPKNLIASQRPYSWLKFWTQAGHDVTVVTVDYVATPSDLKYDLSGYKIIRLKDPVPGRKNMITVQENSRTGNVSVFFAKRVYAWLISMAKKIYMKTIAPTSCLVGNNFPNFYDIWAKDAINAVKHEVWDLVVSTGCPYCVHRVGLYLKTHNLAKKWIVDWRDLWTKNHVAKGFFLFKPYEKFLEKKMHQNADFVTTVSEGLADILRTLTDTPVHVIYNGFDMDDFPKNSDEPRKLNKKFTISYLGTLYIGFREPEPLLVAVQALGLEGKITPDDLEIVFAGDCASIMKKAKKIGVEDYVSYKGMLPREEALRMEYDSDAVLFLEAETQIKGVLTGKLFECMCLSREIWAVGISDKTSAGSLISETNSGICFGTDVEIIKNVIMDRMKHRNEFVERDKNFDIINKFQRKIQAEKMLELVEEKCQK